MNKKLAAALEYLAKGWSVIPCEPNGKKALVNWRDYQKNRPSKEQVIEWYTKNPDANIAVITGRVSGIVVIDVDTYKGGSADGLPATGVRAQSARGGLHFFYRYPEGSNHVGNRANSKTHIDIRADGGYVLIAPSNLAEGEYKWLDRSKLGIAPKWITEGSKQSEQPKDSKSGKQSKWLADLFANGLREGERNDTLARLAGYFYRQRIPVDVCIEIAQNLNRNSVSSLPVAEVTQTVRSAYKTAARNTSKRGDAADSSDAERKEFRVLRADEYARKHGTTETKWLIPKWMPDKTVAFIVAPPESFKSWLLFDLAISVATGLPFLGEAVDTKGPVIIVQQEDFAGQNVQRLRLIYANKCGRLQFSNGDNTFKWDAPTLDGLNVFFHEENLLRFNDTAIMDGLERTIAETGAKMVMIDPLYSAADQDNYMASAIPHMMRLKELRDKYGCSFLIAHHTKKSAEANSREGLWGSQFLNAFLETGWQLRRLNDHPTRIVITRHFKSAQRPPLVNLEFEIDTEKDYGYVTTQSEYVPEESDDGENVQNTSDSIIEYFETHPESKGETPDTLSEFTGASIKRTKRACQRLKEQGILEHKGKGIYVYHGSRLHK